MEIGRKPAEQMILSQLEFESLILTEIFVDSCNLCVDFFDTKQTLILVGQNDGHQTILWRFSY